MPVRESSSAAPTEESEHAQNANAKKNETKAQKNSLILSNIINDFFTLQDGDSGSEAGMTCQTKIIFLYLRAD